MYALFRDGKEVAALHSLVALWTYIVNSCPFAISGAVNNLHFCCTLEKGYTIEEVKE